MFRSKKIKIIVFCVEAILLLYAFIAPYKLLSPAFTIFSDNLIKLRVDFQATTGPRHYIIEDADVLRTMTKRTFGELDTSEIELVGNTSFEFEENTLTGDKITLVYGKLIGVTDKYAKCGSETIPIFRVYCFKPINYSYNFIFDNTIFFIFVFSQLITIYLIISITFNKQKIEKIT